MPALALHPPWVAAGATEGAATEGAATEGAATRELFLREFGFSAFGFNAFTAAAGAAGTAGAEGVAEGADAEEPMVVDGILLRTREKGGERVLRRRRRHSRPPPHPMPHFYVDFVTPSMDCSPSFRPYYTYYVHERHPTSEEHGIPRVQYRPRLE